MKCLRIFKTSPLVVLFAGIVLLIFSIDLQSQEIPVQDIKKIRSLTKAISETEALLDKYPHNEFTPTIMFQLSELYVKRAALKFQKQMMKYEEDLIEYDTGLLENEPPVPRINLSDAINICYKILENYKDIPFRDKVLYRIAICHLEEGNKEKAKDYFEQLITETNNSQFLEESYFRAGEYYFEQQQYKQAIEFYSRLLKSWESQYFNMALYKLGWSYYNVGNYAEAISTFIYLIEDIHSLEQANPDVSGKTKADLRKEAIEYVAISFAEYGGAEKARTFLRERKDKDYTIQVLVHLADLYQKRNYYNDAIETIKVLLDFYPDSPETPKYHKKIVENYELAGDKEKADAARAILISKYGPGSKWISQLPDEEIQNGILETVEEYLYTLGTDAQAQAQETKLAVHYQLAVDRYRSFLRKFPNSKKRSKVLFYIAECLYEIKKYHEAAETYYELLTEFPDSEFRELAVFHRILAYYQMLQIDNKPEPAFLYLSNFLGKKENAVDTIKVVNSVQAHFIQASNDFYRMFPESPKQPEVLMNYAETLYELGQHTLAKNVYQTVINTSATNGHDGYLLKAYTMIAQSAFKEGKFDEAEEWFQKLSQLFPDSVRYVEKAKKMIASSRFKVAESFLEQGDVTRAAEEFTKVARISNDEAVAERALFEAAKQYEKIGFKEKAITIYESMLHKFPESTLIDESLFRAGVLSEELEDWNRAAINYLSLYNHSPNSKFSSKSLYNAAKCYENLGYYEKARTHFDEYTKKYFDEPERYLEAAFRKGDIAYNSGNHNLALRDFQFVVDYYYRFVKQGLLVENFLPANAQFLIGEILFRSFKQIKLVPPFERNLRRKRRAFEDVLKAYAEAAKFKVADWTTASSYKIGVTFEEFANAFLEAPRPRNLSGVALEKYNSKLQKTVLPFKEKALATYQANVKQAYENSIENTWIFESKKRMEALTAELGLNTLDMGHSSGS